MDVIKLNKDNFENIVFSKEKIVLVDFYAQWCGPCKMLGPVIEDFAQTTNKNIIIGKIDVDEEQELASKFNIYSVPTLMVFKDGEVVKTEPGFKHKEALEEFVNV